MLTPAPGFVHRRARRLLKRRERALQHADKRDPGELGIDSVVEAKELKGALELQHRSLAVLRPARHAAATATTVRRVAGLFSQLRSENELGPRNDATSGAASTPRRIAAALPNPLPGPAHRRALDLGARHAVAAPARARQARPPPARDRPARDRAARRSSATRRACCCATSAARSRSRPRTASTGTRLIGGQGGGKSSVMARHFANDARDPERAVILIDPKGPLAELCLGLAPAERTVHYLDLGHPEIGINPLTIDASPGARAAVFLQALIEANPPGAIQAASDSFLRQAVAAVCAVEPDADALARLPHARLRPVALPRRASSRRLERDRRAPTSHAHYWRREFPALLADRGYAAQALNPPRNKLERLISTREIDTLLRHPVTLDLEGILERGEVLIVAGAKATVGEDNTILVTQLLLQLLHRAHPSAPGRCPTPSGGRVSLLIDEAHNVLTPSVAKMLAEGRSAGLEAVFAWQYSAQIRDEVIRSGVRSLLQSISIFRMREMEDARSLAGLAMEVYSDRISVDQDEQERLRFSPDDILKLPIHRAINLWVADGVPRAGFLAHTLPMEELHDEDRRRAPPRRAARARRPPPRPRSPDPLADSDADARARRPTSDARAARQHGAARAAHDDRAGGDRATAPTRCSCRSTSTPSDARRRARGVARCSPESYVEAHRYDGAAIQHDRARPDRALRAPAARRRDRARRLALQVPHRPPAARALVARTAPPAPASAACASSSTPATSSASGRIARRGSYPWTYHLGARRPPPAPTRRPHPRRASATRRAAIYDYGHVLHELQLNAWVLAYRRAARRRLAHRWDGETDIEPPAAGAQRASCGSTTTGPPKGLREPHARLLRPDAVLEIAATTTATARRTFLIEYDRTRRVDKNYDKFRRYDAFLSWWWRHTPLADRDDPPFVLFVCQDEDQREQFLAAADRELTGHRWHPSVPRRAPRVRRPRRESSSPSSATPTPAPSRPGGCRRSRQNTLAARPRCGGFGSPAATSLARLMRAASEHSERVEARLLTLSPRAGGVWLRALLSWNRARDASGSTSRHTAQLSVVASEPPRPLVRCSPAPRSA